MGDSCKMMSLPLPDSVEEATSLNISRTFGKPVASTFFKKAQWNDSGALFTYYFN